MSINDQPSVTPRQSSSIDNHLSDDAKKREALIHLLQPWREGDEQEQRETLEFLQKALDEDRLSDRKLFP